MNIFGDSFMDTSRLRIIQSVDFCTPISPQAILVEVNAERNDYALAMPKAADCALRILTLKYLRGSHNVTIKGSHSDALALTEVVLGSPGNFAVYYSTGRQWVLLAYDSTIITPDIVYETNLVNLRSSATLEAFTMQITYHYLRVATTSGHALTITLPGVAASVGLLFVIEFWSDGGSNVTITDAGDDGAFSDITLTTAGDYAVVLSDGTNWTTLYPTP